MAGTTNEDTNPMFNERTINRDVYQPRLETIAELLLNEIAPGWKTDPHMEGTPKRYAKWWAEFLNPPSSDSKMTTFPQAQVDQMVIVSDIKVWSLCAHHLLPFNATISIGYLAEHSVLGLSKFARMAELEAAQPTSQEALADGIADRIQQATGTSSVAVQASGVHLCMTMRGVRSPATMTTSVTRGSFRDDPKTREEWLQLSQPHQPR